MGTEKYGDSYWCIGRKAKDEEIYLMADSVEIKDGAILFWTRREAPKSSFASFVIPLSEVAYMCATSLMDGCPVSVEHWYKGGKDTLCR